MLSCRAALAFYGWPLISTNTSQRDETSLCPSVRVCALSGVRVSMTVLALCELFFQGGLQLKQMTIIT